MSLNPHEVLPKSGFSLPRLSIAGIGKSSVRRILSWPRLSLALHARDGFWRLSTSDRLFTPKRYPKTDAFETNAQIYGGSVLSDEMSLVTKLIALAFPCENVFEGLTCQAERREKVRVFVRQVPDVVFTIRNGKNITMRKQFYAAYGEEL